MIYLLDCLRALPPRSLQASPAFSIYYYLLEVFQMLGKWLGWFLYPNPLTCLFLRTTDQFPSFLSSVRSWNASSTSSSFSIYALLCQSLPSNGASFPADQPPLLSCLLHITGFSSLTLVMMSVLSISTYEKHLIVFPTVHYCKSFNLDIQLSPYLVQWISSYLTNRSQLVVVDGTSSPTLPVLSGVPQGSVLGPLLFLVFINDVTTQVSEGSFLSLFADDMALYRTIRSTADFSILQCDISSLSVWIRENFLSLQPTKCHAMVLTRKRLPPPEEAFPTLFVEGVPLTYVNSVKYLGILITSNLSWS